MKRIEQAMAHEGQVRRDPHLRAERFVDDWTALQERRVELGTSYQYADARKAIEGRMKTMAEGLGRDPQVSLGWKRSAKLPASAWATCWFDR